MDTQPPVILLVYANDRVDPRRHLRNLGDEISRIRDALQPAEQAGLCQILIEANAGADRVFTVFQDARYRHRIAIFHYAGHADGYQLLLESALGGPVAAHAAGLAAFLGEQRGLELVFLNGCSTAPQVQGLADANCPAVIATSQAINDQAAMEFAELFYRGLGGGAVLESAYNAAVAATQTIRGSNPRGLYWDGINNPTALADRWPWTLSVKPGAESSRHWNLPQAAGDPLFGLPALPRLDLPDSPFRHLSWFAREHAEVFFGRAFQVRNLYDRVTAPDAPPILLFYGQSGVGKSSVLAAGLLPRLEHSHRVHYLRREQGVGLLGTLMQPLDAGTDDPAAAWRQAEADAGRPLLLVLDQAEEAFTRPTADQAGEISAFLDGLQRIFGHPQARPHGRLILSFRKEWLPEFEARLAEQRLPRGRLFLEGLERSGIIAAVQGPTRSERLRSAYGLSVDDGLAGEIADDLLADPLSPLAPTLQVLLTKLWDEARRCDQDHPRFTRPLYLQLKRDGILLGDFLDQQVAALNQWQPEFVQSGLALDLIAFHTTPRGSADQRTETELLTTYAQVRAAIPELVQRCKDGYLLADLATTGGDPVKGSRLAHDTLAPLVRQRFEESDRPGQRARRILDNRTVEWHAGAMGTPLDESDLKRVEAGYRGTRDWDGDEHRLIKASRLARAQRLQTTRRRRVLGRVALAAIVVFGLFAGWQWWQAEQQRSRAEQQSDVARREQELAERQTSIAEEQRQLAEQRRITAERQQRTALARLQATQAQEERERHPVRALLLAVEAVKRPLDTDGVVLGHPATVLRQVIAQTGGKPLPTASDPTAFDPRGRWLATGGPGGDTLLWDLQEPDAAPCVLPGDKTPVTTFAFDPQGRWLAASSRSGDTSLWDLREPDAVRRALPGDRSEMRRLVFDPQGRWLAVAGDASVRFWNLQSPDAGPQVLPTGTQGDIETFDFDQRGRWLAASGPHGIVRLWDLHTAAASPRVLIQDRREHERVFFDPSGRWLFGRVSGDTTVRVWDLQTLTRRPRVFNVTTKEYSMDFDQNGRWLVVQGLFDDIAQIFDLQHPAIKPRVLRGHEGYISSLVFDPKSRWVVTGSRDRSVRLWSLLDGTTEPRVLRHREGVNTLAIDPQGHWLAATGSYSDSPSRVIAEGSHSVQVWDLGNINAEPQVFRHDSDVGTIEFDPSGHWLLTSGGDNLRLWELPRGAIEPRVLSSSGVRLVHKIAVDPSGRKLATIGRGSDEVSETIVSIWSPEHPETAPQTVDGPRGSVLAFEFAPAGRWLAASADSGAAWLLDLQISDSQPKVLRVPDSKLVAIDFDALGRSLVGVSREGVGRVWDLRRLKAEPLVLHGRGKPVGPIGVDKPRHWIATWDDQSTRIWDIEDLDAGGFVVAEQWGQPFNKSWAFDSQGRWLANAGSAGFSPSWLWDLRSMEQEPRELPGHQGVTYALGFDPGGRWFATAGQDMTARLWDLQCPTTEPRVLRGHTGEVYKLAFDPSGRWLATTSADRTARLWDLRDPDGEPQVLYGHTDEVRPLAFDPQGRWLATGSDDGTVRLWRLSPQDLLELACKTAGRNLTREEWRQHVGQSPYQVTCPQFPEDQEIAEDAEPAAADPPEPDLPTAGESD